MAKKTFYVTTPIYYVNSSPHIGSAYTTIAADVLARWNRSLGKDVFFLTGTDEHGKKIQEIAKAKGMPPKEFVDKIASEFKEAWKLLNISNNNFIRTTDKYHEDDVKRVLSELYKKKLIYKGFYEAYYCVGCEQYLTKSDLVEGCCPIHKKEPELHREEAYLFQLSKFEKTLLKAIKTNKFQILPAKRKNEVIKFIESGLQDVSISRRKSEVPWGIELPFDKEHTCYVWVDAFWNYNTGLKTKENKSKFWPPDVQLMAQDILRVHTTIWPAILLALKLKLPKTMFIHGYFTFEGQKMSKSLGNIIDPVSLTKKYGADSVRYYVLRAVPFGDDGDVSEAALVSRHNNELADKLGNLVSRVSTLAEKYGIKKAKPINTKPLVKKVEKHIEKYEFDKALSEIFSFIDNLNELVQKNKPWETHNSKFLYQITNAIKDVSILLSPFIPETAEKISKVFNFQLSLKSLKTPLKISKIKKAQILFTKIEVGLPQRVSEFPVVRKHEGTADFNLRVRGESSKSKSNSVQTNMAKEEKFSKKAGKAVEKAIDVTQAVVKGVKEALEKSKKMEGIVQFGDWEKIDLRVAKVKKAEDIEGADKLYKLSLDVGELGERIVCAGLKGHYTKEELKGKKLIYFENLAPRMMKGINSQGMVLAAVSKDHSKVILLSVEKDMEAGSKVS